MNPDKTREAIAVMQAYVDGKQIQSRASGIDTDASWRNVNGSAGETPSWDWKLAEYRVEPPPPPAPTTPEDFWIVVVKASKRPAPLVFTSLEDAKKWIGYAGEYYDVVHLKPVKGLVEWQAEDRVVLSRLSSPEEYDGNGGPGWDEYLAEYLGKVGTVTRAPENSSYVLVRFDIDHFQSYFFSKDLDPA